MSVSKYVKSEEEIQKMRVAGALAAEVLEMLAPYVVKGVTTAELNDRAHHHITEVQKAIPAPLNYRGFPKSICTSVNHVVCHGIPKDKPLKNGDILNIDVTVIKDGYHGDTSQMFSVGPTSVAAKKVMRVAQECLYLGISMVKPGLSLKKLGAAIEGYALAQRCSSVYEYCGHGIGSDFHESNFQVLHYDDESIPEIILEPGLTFTIEPMINSGSRHVRLLGDDWTVITKDRSLSAQWEHTVLVTEIGCEVLTKRKDEVISLVS